MTFKRPLRFIIFFVIFCVLTAIVESQALLRSDIRITQAIQTFASRPQDYVWYLFTLLGSVEVTSSILIFFCFYVYRKTSDPRVFFYLFSFVIFSLIELVLKYQIHYVGPGPEFDRNPFHLTVVSVHTPYSYPSGHTFRSFFLLGMWDQWQRKSLGVRRLERMIWRSVALCVASAVIYSRVYLGDHWTSDVLGGILLAGLALCGTYRSIQYELRTA